MAKRTHRTRRQEQTAIPTGVNVQQQPAALPVVQKIVDFASEYAYVYKEMRNVFIIAVIMLVVLFALSYVVY